MPRSIVLILAFITLFASSCAMKNLVWEYFGIEKATTTKILNAFKEIKSDRISFQNSCTSKAETYLDGAEMVSPTTAKAPLLLFFGFLLLPWKILAISSTQKLTTFNTEGSFPHTVPIYLKLNQLVYYS